MSNSRRPHVRILLVAILCAGICWAETGEAFVPSEGEALTALNVRKAPRRDSRAVGWLNRGQRFTVKGQKGEWYRVVLRGAGKNDLEGWVHGGYIKVFPGPEQDVSSALAELKAEIVAEEMGGKAPVAGPEDQGLPSGKTNGSTGRSRSQAAAAPVAKPGKTAPPVTLLKDKGGRPGPLPGRDAALPSQSGGPETDEIRETRAHLPAAPTRVSRAAGVPARRAIPITKGPGQGEQEIWNGGKGSTGDDRGFSEAFKLALRFLSVLLSCLAILFSYRAIKLAKISYNASVQLQNRLQALQGQEDISLE